MTEIKNAESASKSMIRFPVFTHLRIEQYGLFPGEGKIEGIDWDFKAGLSLIAGINGLGKTTLLNVLLRSLTGPYDLTGDGPPDELNSVLPPTPVLLNARNLRYFAQRVADDAVNATARLTVMFGRISFVVQRSLSDLRLISLTVDEQEQELGPRKAEREQAFQAILCKLFGLSSFIDVILILHHVVFFKEDRPGALWDENAQRQILRALFLENSLAAKIADLERRVQSADSNARNIRARAFNTEQELNEAKRREANLPGLEVRLQAEQQLLAADVEQREQLELRLNELDNARKAARLENEKSKLRREEADNKLEQQKYATLSRLFPRMEDAARLVILKALTTGECLVCGADAKERSRELHAMLEKGICPACEAPPEKQLNVVAPHEVERARAKRDRAAADLARSEELASAERLSTLVSEYNTILTRISELRDVIEDRQSKERKLTAQLPLESAAIRDMARSLEVLKRSQREAEATRAAATKELLIALQEGQAAIVRRSKSLTLAFHGYVKALLAEDAELVRIEGAARLTQGGQDFSVPAFSPEMSSAGKAGLSRRSSPSDVSESQRELIDLAFRLALLTTVSAGLSSTLAMETPEASLDGLAMTRVGTALHSFAFKGENRLIVTSNLTNAGMIAAMFGGPIKKAAELTKRKERVLNLLKAASPNMALQANRQKYNRLLESAIEGNELGRR